MLKHLAIALLAGALAVSPGLAQTRPIEHEKGVTEVPIDPQRIVTISALGIEDNLLALGVKPLAGSSFAHQATGFYKHIAPDLEGVLQIDGNAPNLEYLLSLEPDLIIAEGSQRGSYDQLSLIAPTVLHTFNGDWRAMHRKLGEILGKEAEADRNIADYEAAVAPLKAELAAALNGETVMFVMVFDKQIRVQGVTGHGFNDVLYADLGLVPEASVPTTEMRAQITAEGLSAYQPDHIFVQVESHVGGDANFAQIETSPVWQAMKAVQAGNVHKVPAGENWLAMAWGIKGRLLVADAIRDALLK